MNNSDREWMYDRLLEDGFINPRFIDGVKIFIEFAKSHPECMNGEKLRCPCNNLKCQNKNILDEFTVMTHLENNGFVPNYYRWHHHGENYIPGSSVFDNHQEEASASAPHLQRLYASVATTKHMRWHSDHERDGVMHHSSDSPSWKQFDQTHPSFASEMVCLLTGGEGEEKEENEDENKDGNGKEDDDEEEDDDDDDDDEEEEEEGEEEEEEECELHKKKRRRI
ncbi:hypothetical protein CQW23_15233 [Capsicum baccatum]|uniref:Transposase-associated domain-containing protein n=1 Tax=Capsicum baccatum TaxID=33114 RepID=A0A2G2WLG0_CAPBA|nr:hypothetical protein CQW23_15233 [Capsicum baccatum]